MTLKGASYDVGRVRGMNWRPSSTPTSCTARLRSSRPIFTARRICGRSIARLVAAAEDALDQGFEVWLSPALWKMDVSRNPG